MFNRLRRFLLPEPHRKLPHGRGWNIGLRTAHIAVMGILLGGHVFEIPRGRLVAWLYATILTGGALMVVEVWPSCQWFYQGRGVFMLVKLLLLCLIPWFWPCRVHILLLVLVIASVGAHMPGRFRYYSVIHRRVLD